MTIYALEDIELAEISAVDDPANQHAAVVLCKHSGYKPLVKPEMSGALTKGDGSVTVEELTKTLEALQMQVADLTKRAADAETVAAVLTKSAEDAGLEIADGKIVKRADPEYVEIDGEKVEKALVPAAVLRAIEKQAADIAQMKREAEEVELAKRGASELPNLPGTDLAKGRLIAAVGSDADMLKALRAADAAMAAQFVEKGHSDPAADTSPSRQLDELAKARAAATGKTFHAAYAEVIGTPEGAELMRALRSESN